MLRKREIKQGFKELSKCVHIGSTLDEFLKKEGLLDYIEKQAKEKVESYKNKKRV